LYPQWAKWWEENQKFSQQRWNLDGFAAMGLHAVEPLDEQFALELIDVLGTSKNEDGDHSYHWFSAERLIASAPPGKRLEWAARAAASEQKPRRMGALVVLRSMETAGDEDLIRKLAVDPDIEMRRGALSILNVRLRRSKSVGSKDTRVSCHVEPDSSGLLYLKSVSFAGGSLIVAYDDKVTAYDPRTRRMLWTKAIPEMGEQVLAIGEQLVFDSWKGDVFALDGRGNLLWRKASEGAEKDRVQRLLRLGDDVVVVRQRVVEQLDAKTGRIKHRADAEGDIKDADGTSASVYFVDESGLHSLNGGPGRERAFKDAAGISVSDKAICVSSGSDETEGIVTCLNTDGVTEQWSQSIKDKQPVTPIQDGARVFVPTSNSLTAFNASNGSLLWTIEDGYPFVTTPYGLLSSGGYALDLCDPQTGAVIRAWPEIFGVRHIAVHGRFAAIATSGDILWLVDLEQE
jgi:outer membrane protein assembly factor BamB